LAFGGAFAVAVGIYLAFNWLRFGNPLDTGYSMWWEVDSFMIERMKQFGPFHPVYFFHNFAYMFLQGFHLEFSLPMYLNKPHLDPFGTSLTFASPFIFFAFKARGAKLLLWGAWLSVGLCLLHALFYFGNGWVQENGIRYALDFFPSLNGASSSSAQGHTSSDLEGYNHLFRCTQPARLLLDLLCLGFPISGNAMGQKDPHLASGSLGWQKSRRDYDGIDLAVVPRGNSERIVSPNLAECVAHPQVVNGTQKGALEARATSRVGAIWLVEAAQTNCAGFRLALGARY
jgi:hypothetical protein